MVADADERIRKIYLDVLTITNKWIQQCKTSSHIGVKGFNFDHEQLNKMNPNAEQMAKDLRFCSTIVRELYNYSQSYDNSNILLNIEQCAVFLESIAIAIASNNTEDLANLYTQLQNHTNKVIV